MPTKKSAATSIDSLRHTDKRANIPTEELRDFVADDERAPKTVRYPRDPSLDPQLVWKGKEEQDRTDLAVPAVPIYIQEKIQPQAIIENVRAQARSNDFSRSGADDSSRHYDQPALFADFNAIEDFATLTDFYHHEDNWSNRMILGDSLLVMTSLAEKEGLKGKVQMIYLDPPYGIKFGSNWQVSTRKRDVKDGKAEDATRQPEQVRAFRDTWKLGIHSYLAYLRDRLVVARELLTETGSVFVQIGDENVHLVRNVLDEVFGSENFCAMIFFLKTTGKGGDVLDASGDYILWYARSLESVKVKPLFRERDKSTISEQYTMIDTPDGGCRRLSEAELRDPDPALRRFMPSSVYSDSGGSTTSYRFQFHGESYSCLPGYFWRTTEIGMSRLGVANRMAVVGRYLRYKMYADDYPVVRITNYWDDVRAGGFGDA